MEKEYPVSLGAKISYGIFSAIIFVVGIIFFNMPHTSKTPEWFNIIPTLMLITSILVFINIFKRKVIIYDDRIVTIGLFSTKELFIKSIKGVRIEEKIIIIEPLNSGDTRLKIGNYSDLKNNRELREWLSSNCKDLDAIDLADEHNKILHDSELGLSETEREQKLKNAKKVAHIYNIIGVAVSVAVLVFNITVTTVVLSILYPLIGIVVIANSKGLIKFLSSPKRSVHPNVFIGLLFPALSTLLTSLNNYTIYESDNLGYLF